MSLHYFYRIERRWWHERVLPALAASRRQRSFAPCLELCRDLARRDSVAADALVRLVPAGLRYDLLRWHALIDECLVYGADALPRLPCLAAALQCLTAATARPAAGPKQWVRRSDFSPIDQAYFGARDLRLGGTWHRPDYVGWNDAADIDRLAAYLRSVDPERWTSAQLAPLTGLADEQERTEELAYLRDEWPALVALYDQAQAAGQIVVCERVDAADD
ncbi:MAG: hypothetical protein NZO58_00585 [Gemmataceae bacterium]|nr:hypothetical protein [Gemmataceae bacterium]